MLKIHMNVAHTMAIDFQANVVLTKTTLLITKHFMMWFLESNNAYDVNEILHGEGNLSVLATMIGEWHEKLTRA